MPVKREICTRSSKVDVTAYGATEERDAEPSVYQWTSIERRAEMQSAGGAVSEGGELHG